MADKMTIPIVFVTFICVIVLEFLILMTIPIIKSSSIDKKAQRKSLRLLWRYLTPDQRHSFKRTKSFVAIGNKTGTRYTVDAHPLINISAPKYRYCVRPRKVLPMGDILLAQKLMIENDEDEFLERANKLSR